MLQNIENLNLTGVLRGTSALHRAYPPRPSHGLIFKRSGESEYRFPGKTIRLCQGNVLLIPQGTPFVVTQLSAGNSCYIALNFSADISGICPTIFHPKWNHAKVFAMLDHCCALDPATDQYQLLSSFYLLLAGLTQPLPSNSPICEKDCIAPAVEYLQQHLFDADLSVGMLHTLCDISDTYFRKRFICKFGTSPKKYILEKRLSQAKAILDNREHTTVSEVAFSVGFEDPLYFSKVFRLRYGYPPSLTP